ncbi:MAG: hypothetical protein OEM02_10810 [Desulfobulbaceae bacterium]|nr:hypothetical protein [Desulfobulbaceae bacterium]
MLTRLLDMGDHFVGGMTTRKYAGMCKFSKVTASRDFGDLEARGILQICRVAADQLVTN